MNNKSKKNAQQLVEFALILPILMIILIVIVEIGLALNIRLSLSEAAKLSVAQSKISYNQIGNTLEDKLNAAETPILAAIKNYFTNHNLPYADTLAVNIAPLTDNQMALVIVSYNYKPVFVLPNIFGGSIIPTQYTFISTQIINAALLDVNSELFNYNNATSTYNTFILSAFDKTSSNFDARTSVLKSQDIDGIDVRYQLAFLVGFNTNDYKYARLFNWWGEDLLPQNLAFAVDTGNLVVKSPYYSSSWVDTSIPYTWILSSLGFSQALYAKMDSNPSGFRTNKLDLASSNIIYNAGIPWFNQSACTTCGSGDSDPFKGDMTSNDVDNLIKRGVSFLFDSADDGMGSLDTLLIADSGPSPIKNYTFVKPNGGYSNLLKLFIPANAIKPADPSNGYSYSFYIDTSGMLAANGAHVDIVDCYLDNDGDGIPNAWDGRPGSATNTEDANYFDRNANAVFDGEDSSITAATRNTALADTTAIASGILIKTVYPSMPMKIDGTLNTASYTYAPIPVPSTAPYAIQIYKVGTAWYYKNGAQLTRKVSGWNYSPSVDTSKKVNFIFGTDGTTTINLKKSVETDKLGTGAFSFTNKVLF